MKRSLETRISELTEHNRAQLSTHHQHLSEMSKKHADELAKLVENNRQISDLYNQDLLKRQNNWKHELERTQKYLLQQVSEWTIKHNEKVAQISTLKDEHASMMKDITEQHVDWQSRTNKAHTEEVGKLTAQWKSEYNLRVSIEQNLKE